jgi:hypothetical protein
MGFSQSFWKTFHAELLTTDRPGILMSAMGKAGKT